MFYIHEQESCQNARVDIGDALQAVQYVQLYTYNIIIIILQQKQSQKTSSLQLLYFTSIVHVNDIKQKENKCVSAHSTGYLGISRQPRKMLLTYFCIHLHRKITWIEVALNKK